jgi:predicted dehydrogenase
MKKNILLIGSGPMAIDYYNVLSKLNVNVIVIGRGESSATKFTEITGAFVITGGLESFLSSHLGIKYEKAIIATGTENLMNSLKLLIKSNINDILVEKPAAISIHELIENKTELLNSTSNIYVAYNRRFYSSVTEAKKIIDLDGGLSSIHFEFTEWSHIIAPLKKADGVKENWFFANSTHVVDLAFYLAGKPIDWHAYNTGNNGWHTPTNFCGSGITTKNILFSYQANWEAPGRWSVELLTKKHRIYLKPMEKVFIQKIGSVAINEHTFDTSEDIVFKPGLFQQCKAFLENPFKLLSIEEHIKNSEEIYLKILKSN